MNDRPNPAFYALLVALVVMSAGPIFLMLATSLKLNVDIMDDSASLFFLPTLQNYETVLCNVLWYEPGHVDYCDKTFGRALGNSLIITIISTALTLVMGCMAAYALVRFRFMGRGAVSLTTLAMRMVPPAVLLVPVFGIWSFQFGLDGTYAGIILVYVAMNLPFVIWILQSFIVQVPIQLEEAARMDGAGPFQTFFLIVLPVIRPGPRGRGDLHLPHRLERVPASQRPVESRHANRPGHHRQLPDGARHRLGRDHGDRHPAGDPADHLHLRRLQADHHRDDCGRGEGLSDRARTPDRDPWSGCWRRWTRSAHMPSVPLSPGTGG